MGLLISSINIKDIIIDKCKVDRAKTKVKTTAQQKHDQNMMGEWIRIHCCIRKFVEENGQKTTKKKTKGPERHLTFTKETSYDSKYLTQISS